VQEGRLFNSEEMEEGTVTGNNNLKTFITLMRLGCSSGFHLTRQWVFKVFQAMVEEFHGKDKEFC
jgi:hypothetical protein